MTSMLCQLARFCVRHRLVVPAVWLVLTGCATLGRQP
jgi:hypothetical protein